MLRKERYLIAIISDLLVTHKINGEKERKKKTVDVKNPLNLERNGNFI